MVKAIGRFLKKIMKSLKKAAKVILGIPDNSKKKNVRKYVDQDGVVVHEEIEEVDLFEDAATDWVAFKLVSIMVVASGVFFLTWPASPALSPLTAAIGGAMVNHATQLWRGQEWDPKTL